MGADRSFAMRVHHLLALRRGAVALRLALALLFLLAGVSLPAHAVIPVQPQWRTDIGGGQPGFSKVEACNNAVAFSNSSARSGKTDWINGGVQETRCAITSPSLGSGFWANFLALDPVCPAHSGAVSGGCECASGYVENAGKTACEVPPPPPSKCRALSGTGAGQYSHDSGVNAAGNAPLYGDFSLSVDGCKVQISNPSCLKNNALGGGWFVCTGEAIYTGDDCASASACVSNKPFGQPAATPTPPEPTPAPNPDPSIPTPKPEEPRQAPCPAGQAPGTFNGTTMCQPAGAEGTAGTSQGSIRNPDGSGSDVTTTTKCASAAKCTTDTTTCTVMAGGSAGSCSTTTTTGTVQAVCDRDKGNSVCAAGAGGTGTAGAFGGDCTKGFKAVSDDVVLNAMAEEQYKRNCTFFGLDTDVNSVANKAKSGADGQNTDTMKAAAANAPVTIQTFDMQGRGWARSCPPDPSFSLPWAGGRSFSIPFSRICTPLQLFALAGVALTMLGSFVWVMGGKR